MIDKITPITVDKDGVVRLPIRGPAAPLISLGDWAREKVGDRRADVTRAPALNHLEDHTWAFWRGDFERGPFKLWYRQTVAFARTAPSGAWVGLDDRYYEADRDREILEADFQSVNRDDVRGYLCRWGFLPAALHCDPKKPETWPSFSVFESLPLDRFLENGDDDALAGFQHLAEMLSIPKTVARCWHSDSISEQDRSRVEFDGKKRKKKLGRPKTSGAFDDSRFIERMRALLKEGDCTSVAEAARFVFDEMEVPHKGIQKSAEERLARKFRQLR